MLSWNNVFFKDFFLSKWIQRNSTISSLNVQMIWYDIICRLEHLGQKVFKSSRCQPRSMLFHSEVTSWARAGGYTNKKRKKQTNKPWISFGLWCCMMNTVHFRLLCWSDRPSFKVGLAWTEKLSNLQLLFVLQTWKRNLKQTKNKLSTTATSVSWAISIYLSFPQA